ncbi:AAA family ATPase [Streptomyces sp. NPDC003011]
MSGVPFVGREEELREVREALAPRRMVVLTGPSGIGKSALARQVTRTGPGSPEVFRIEDVGVRERPETTLLRLLDAVGARPGRLADVVEAPADRVRDTVVELCRRELADRMWPVLVVDGAGGPLLDALRSVVQGSNCQVLALTEQADVPPSAYRCQLGDLSWPAARRLVGEAAGYGSAPDATADGTTADGTTADGTTSGGTTSGGTTSGRTTSDAAADRLVRPATLGRPALTPLALRIGGALAGVCHRTGDLPDTLPGLIASARELLRGSALRLWDALAALTAPDGLWLPDELVARLLPDADASDGRRARCAECLRRDLALLEGLGLLERDGTGVRLHRAVVAQLTRDWPREEARERALAAARPLLWEARRSPSLIGDHPTPYLLLVTRMLSARDPEVRSFSAYLADELAHRGRVFALLALRECVRHELGEDEGFAAPLALALRRCEEPALARKVLPHDSPGPAERLQLALLWRDLGRLRDAERHLAGLSSGRGADGWVLHTKAAVACDRGDLRGVGPLLRRAIEAHQVAGDLRGEAWAVLEYGRWCLLRGDFDDAVKQLSAARMMFLDIKDPHGGDWADTELLRLSVVSRDSGLAVTETPGTPGTFVRTRRTPGHSRVEAWRALYSGLLREGEPGTAPGHGSVAMAAAVAGYEYGSVARHRSVAGSAPGSLEALRLGDAADALRGAWDAHYLGLRDDTPGYLAVAARRFTDAGCPHGEAWTALEQGIRQPLRGPGRHALARARALFDSIGDEAGRAWTDLARTVLDGEDPPRAVLWELSRRCPPSLLAAIEWPQERGRFRVPRAARHTVPEPRYDGVPRFPTTESHLRLTLLDDAPGADRAARIALRLVPGVHHPWASAAGPGLPWLSARAIPLTAADVQPEHAVALLPSAGDGPGAGAEFRFTPRRPGRHRIRFVVEHHATGVVLQEVETEIDTADAGDGAPPAATPLSEPLRGR